MDRISKLPHAIIETILCLVPIKDAARTSVLSKEWRYSWTKIPKLVFNEYIFKLKTIRKNNKPYRQYTQKLPSLSLPAICKILKMHEGTIDEITIEMNTDESESELDDILVYLSGKSVRKLTLEFKSCSLPSSLFSLNHLTDLCLICCALDHEPVCSINSLRLTTLHLEESTITRADLIYFLSKCPLLKTVTMLQNYLCKYGDTCDTDTSTIIDMFECLPMVENLSISTSIIQCSPSIREGPRKLPTGLVHLKYIYIEDMSFDYDYDQISKPCLMLGLLLRSSPNLEKLVVRVGDSMSDSYTVEYFSDIWLEHLNEFIIENITIDYKRMNTNDELEFAKVILAKSPVLKKVKIFIKQLVDEDKKLLISKILSSFLHASPMVNIIVERQIDDDD